MRGLTVLAPMAAMSALLVPSAGGAQLCATTTTRSAASDQPALRVRSVNIRVDSGEAPPHLSSLSQFRSRTRDRVVFRELLVSANGVLDSARIAESMRRLRALRLFADVSLATTRCTGSDSVDLVVAVRDAWTLRPIARVTPPSTASIGLEDRNLLGTGRTVSATRDQTARGHGGTVSAVDPWLFGTNTVGALRYSDVAGTHLLRSSLRHEEWPFVDPWRYEFAVNRQRFADTIGGMHPRRTFAIGAALGHMIGDPRRTILVPYLGADIDEAESVVPGSGTVLIRRFSGSGIGLHHRAAQFDTLGWFTRGRGLLDIPLGWQSDLYASAGYDRGQRANAARYDGWLGRMWIPSPGRLVAADFWTQGFVGDVRDNHIDRASVSAFVDAGAGFWAARVTTEQLLDLDPDLRSLSLAAVGADPSFPAIPTELRRANRSAVSSIERSAHLHVFGRGSRLDGALFGAGSVRWDTPDVPGSFRIAVAGLRLRLLSANGVLSSTRLDLAYPVLARGGSVVHRPQISVSVASLLDAPHQRDGRRRQQ
jgi:hypothetical protein